MQTVVNANKEKNRYILADLDLTNFHMHAYAAHTRIIIICTHMLTWRHTPRHFFWLSNTNSIINGMQIHALMGLFSC